MPLAQKQPKEQQQQNNIIFLAVSFKTLQGRKRLQLNRKEKPKR